MNFYETAVQDLNYRLAKIEDDGTITHYLFPLLGEDLSKPETIIHRAALALEDHFKTTDICIDRLPKNQVGHQTTTHWAEGKLSSKARAIFNKTRCLNSYYHYALEIPSSGLVNNIKYFLKKIAVNLALKLKLHTNKILKSWFNDIKQVKTAEAISFGCQYDAEDSKLAYDKISQVIEYLSEFIVAGGWVRRIEIADTVGDRKRRYIVHCRILVSAKIAGLFDKLLPDDMIIEKDMYPINISKSKMPKITEVKMEFPKEIR